MGADTTVFGRKLTVLFGSPYTTRSFHPFGQVAQSVERGPEKAGVGGSIPSLATNSFNNLAIAKQRVKISRANNTRTSVWKRLAHWFHTSRPSAGGFLLPTRDSCRYQKLDPGSRTVNANGLMYEGGLPDLTPRCRSLSLGYCCLRDLYSQFQQFIVNPWSSPQRICSAHLHD